MIRKISVVTILLGCFAALPVMAQTTNGQDVYYKKVYKTVQGPNGSYQNTNEPYFVPVSANSVRRTQNNAYGIHGGNAMISVFGGASRSVNKVEGLEWGRKGGFMLGASAMIFPWDVFGIGVEFDSTQFAKIRTRDDFPGANTDERTKIRMNDLLVALRFNVNPSNRVRFYMPLGAGVAFQRVESDVQVYPLYGPEIREKITQNDHGFAGYAGLGLEGSITKNLVLGLEARFNGARVKKENFFYVTGAAKIGVKF